MPTEFISKKDSQGLLFENLAILRRNILLVLKEKKMTQVELANKIDCHKQYINYILNDPMPNPSLEAIGKIAAGLDVLPSDLLNKSLYPKSI